MAGGRSVTRRDMQATMRTKGSIRATPKRVVKKSNKRKY